MVTPLKYLLDTNICIYIAKKRPKAALARFKTLQPGEVGTSTNIYGELRYGASKSQRHADALQTLTGLTALIPVLALDASVGERYGEIRRALEIAGTPIGNNDLWIAAHGLSLDVTLVTNNKREFSRVAGLSVENWTAD